MREPTRGCTLSNVVKGPWNVNDDSYQTSTVKSCDDKNPEDIQEIQGDLIIRYPLVFCFVNHSFVEGGVQFKI